MQTRIRTATEGRGFAESRLLTHWTEIVGEQIAGIARPVKISYGRGALGATLTVLTTGSNAPMLEMQKPQLLERVNACYGYRAISRIHITQTAPTGFADGRAQFDQAPKVAPEPDPAVQAEAKAAAAGVGDDNLRAALEALTANFLTKQKT
ncbi:hypothetical protein SAMN05428995_101399 [Loktanella sp. DSM 29012]|nr:hypothetical protein SAMN05428995_101399 [Loktanella sp. DSM 29012]